MKEPRVDSVRTKGSFRRLVRNLRKMVSCTECGAVHVVGSERRIRCFCGGMVAVAYATEKRKSK